MMKIGRNDPCYCGSGKKYKKCCLKKDNYLNNLPNNALKMLREEFSKYNQKELIKTLVALSLCPENQSQYVRLEVATQIACSNTQCGNRDISIKELNELFLKYLPSKGPIGLLEDPIDNLFTNNIEFYKNNIIFSGPSTTEYHILQNIINCIQYNSSSFSDEFMELFYQNSKFILYLSDFIAKKSGHERYEVFDNRFREEIFFPNINELNNLKKCVTFDINKLKVFKNSINIKEMICDDFIIEIGDKCFMNIIFNENDFYKNFNEKTLEEVMYSENIYKNPLFTYPIIKIDDTYLIYPQLLTISLRHNILSNIIKYNEKKNFISKYQNYLWSNILLNLKNKLQFEDLNYELPKWENTIFKDKIFKIDTDKLTYCILINDNLKDYDKNGPCERIDLNYKFIIKNRIKIVKKHLSKSNFLNGDLLIILFVGMSGRSYVTEISENDLIINTEEFEILVNSGNYDSLILYKFANLLKNSNIFGCSFLNIFSFYIDNNHSFYMDDRKIDSTLLTFDFTADFTKKLRIKAIKDKDSHLEIYENNLINVNKINDFVYIAYSNLFLTKIINQNIWVKCENNFESDIAKAICFWLCQFGDEIYKDLKLLKEKPIFISFNLEENNLDLNSEITNQMKDNIIISSHVSKFEINFTISKNLIIISNQKNNEADLLLMNEILKLFGTLLEKNNLENKFTPERILKIIHKELSLGLKKYILIYDLEDINNIPVKTPIRLLQEHNIQLLMNDLVTKIQCKFDYNQKLTKKESVELSHQIVNYFIECIKKEIVKYDWDNLIKKLILNYENILFNRSISSVNNLYYYFNNKDNSSVIQDIVSDDYELDKLSISTRILIEILSAEQNFNSKVKISNENFDTLMALTYNYIEWTFNSDYINSDYIDFEITPLESNRFGIKTNLGEIFDTFRNNKSLEHINNFSTNIDSKSNIEEKPSDELDEAFKSEFDITLTEYADFVYALISLAQKNEEDIVFISKSNLINHLKCELNWEYNKSSYAIDNFSLKYRDRWEIPPEGYSENDIYPWVFRRSLSYYLKPLIIKNDKNETVIYGFRNVYHSGLNLINLITKGVYKTNNSSKKFTSLISKMIDKKGKEFNEIVFKWFADNLNLSKKFNYKLESNIQIDKIVKVEPKYGDIDILLLDKDKQRLFSIECKNIESARNPREIIHEIERFFDDKNWIKKHQRREDWIKNNFDKLGDKIGNNLKNYKIFSMFIVSEELPIIYLKKNPIDIIPFSQIKKEGLGFLDKYY